MSDGDKLVCDYKHCSRIPTQKWRVTGIGRFGPTTNQCVYCDQHSRSHAEPSGSHCQIGLVNEGGRCE